MQESDQYISSIDADEEVFRLKAKRDWDNCINTAIMEGAAKAKVSIARNLKSMGMSISDISRATGLQEEEIVSI